MDSQTTRSQSADRVHSFRRSLAPDLFSPSLFVPWNQIDRRFEQLSRGISVLQTAVDAGLTKSNLFEVIHEEPSVLELVRLVFAAPQGAGFFDGRELPTTPPESKAGQQSVARLAVDLGLAKILTPGSSVASVVKTALIANDARSRGYRRRDAIEEQVLRVLQSAIDDVQGATGSKVERLATHQHPSSLRNRVDEILVLDERPIAAVVTVFQAQSGGRQQRELIFTYPRLQQELDELPAHLILIADGRGLAETPVRVLRQLMDSVAAVMSLAQAEEGQLGNAIRESVERRGARPGQLALTTLIRARLEREGEVRSSDLPVPPDRALLELAQYVAERPETALVFDTFQGVLRWERPGQVTPVRRLTEDFEPAAAASTLADLLAGTIEREVNVGLEGLRAFQVALPEDRVLPRHILVAASATDVDENAVKRVARAARADMAESSVAILIGASAPTWRRTADQRKMQSMLATSVVVLTPSDLVEVASSRVPRDAVVRHVLEQADLSKANPFSYTGVTPREMFFGREGEVASLRAILGTNSAAILGGRRIGKTSLLCNALRRLCWATVQTPSGVGGRSTAVRRAANDSQSPAGWQSA